MNKGTVGRMVSFHQSITELRKKSLHAFTSAPREIGTMATKLATSPSTLLTVYSAFTASV
jgi:hypothetical protein